jgi:hypothetical protein
MKPSHAFKIMGLLLTLVIVMYAMRHINDNSMQGVFQALGVDAGGGSNSPGFQASGRARVQGEERIAICPTRIHSITWADGRRIEETENGLKLKWMGYVPDARELTYLEVERWLSQHCQVVGQPLPLKAQDQPAPYLTIQYVDGSKIEIYRMGDDLFRFGAKGLYRSKDFVEAIRELEHILTGDIVS